MNNGYRDDTKRRGARSPRMVRDSNRFPEDPDGWSGPRCFCGVWAVWAPLFLWRVGPFMGPSWRLGSRRLRGLLALHRSLGFQNVCAFRGVFVLLKTHPRLQRCDSATLRRKSLRSLTASRNVRSSRMSRGGPVILRACDIIESRRIMPLMSEATSCVAGPL